MNILDHQEVLNHELELLDIPGEALSNFYIYHAESTAFMAPSSTQVDRCLRDYKMKKVRTCGNRVNSQFTMLTCILMKIIFGPNKRVDLLEKLKCTLYSPDVKLDNIVAMPARGLNSELMKKILVEFFQVMQYHEGACQPILDKYLVVLEIFTLFFRTILMYMDVPNAEHYNKQVNPHATIPAIFDYFDLNYQANKNVYFLFDDQIAILIESRTGESLYGSLEDNSPAGDLTDRNIQNGFNFEQADQLFEEGEDDRREHAPTPCFPDFSEEEVNFNKKGIAGRKNSLNQNKLKMTAFETKMKEEMIQQEFQEQENDDKRRGSLQNRRKSEDICQKKIYYDFEDQRQRQELQAVQSPKISSPADDLQRDFQDIFAPKQKAYKSPKNPEQIGTYRNIQKATQSTSKSDIFKNKKTKNEEQNPLNAKVIPRSTTEEDQYSIASGGSCTCTEKKIRKNQLFSHVIDLSYHPGFTKKPNSPPQIYSMRSNLDYESFRIEKKSTSNNNNQSYKIPSFLTKRQIYKTPNEPKGKIFYNSQKFLQKTAEPHQNLGVPRINFSYANNKKTYIVTEPTKPQPYSKTECKPRQIWEARIGSTSLYRPQSFL